MEDVMRAELDTEAAIGSLLDLVAAALARQVDQILLEQLGVGLAQYKILAVLERQTNLPQRAVAQGLGQTEASISRQVQILRTKSLITAQIDPENRRVHYLALTAKGAQLAEAARHAMARYQKTTFENLGEKQRKQLLDMLHALHAALYLPGDPAAYAAITPNSN